MDIRLAETFVTFKKSLKTFLFKKILMLIVFICLLHVVLLMIFPIPVIVVYGPYSVMVSLLLLMSFLWNVCILCFM